VNNAVNIVSGNTLDNILDNTLNNASENASQNTYTSILPAYIKNHSWGEYVFDWSWAEAYQAHELNYYPKLVSTIPFTPIPSEKLLSNQNKPQPNYHDVFTLLTQHCQQQGIHSWHVLFAPELQHLPDDVYQRHTVQFHWYNRQYQSFEHYLDSFTARKRKNTRKERLSISQQHIEITQLTGQKIGKKELDYFYLTYQLTYLKKGHTPHLTYPFFEALLLKQADDILLVMASHQDDYVACALFLYDDTTLYGRYWGCSENVKNLHFELCYYQGIEFCIEHQLTSFNPGTQGEHKIQRGFEPVLTHSYHWIQHPAFKAAINDFCQQECQQMKDYLKQCQQALPFKQNQVSPLMNKSPDTDTKSVNNNLDGNIANKVANKAFSQACENNKDAILSTLQTAFKNSRQVLEIGSGTGQHAVYFARNLPHLQWQTSDLLINHAGINQWITQYPSNNLSSPITVDLNTPWAASLTRPVDAIFTANTLHIISWPLVHKFFDGVAQCLAKNGTLCIYGPFNYQGKFTSASNADFDLWLKDRDSGSGIRDFEAIQQLAQTAGLTLTTDHAMPANNRLLVLTKA
jgi:predicted N-acyltransferase